MALLPDKEKLLRNFLRCANWEEKYLYIIELGQRLPELRDEDRSPQNSIQEMCIRDRLAKGINEEVVRAISAKRNEPEWMLEFRLNAYRAWLEMEEPHDGAE